MSFRDKTKGEKNMNTDDKNCAEHEVNSIDWLALRINYLIARKNFITATAERETSLGGWQFDHAKEQFNIDSEIEELFEKANESK